MPSPGMTASFMDTLSSSEIDGGRDRTVTIAATA
jgi:hypothetical protein